MSGRRYRRRCRRSGPSSTRRRMREERSQRLWRRHLLRLRIYYGGFGAAPTTWLNVSRVGRVKRPRLIHVHLRKFEQRPSAQADGTRSLAEAGLGGSRKSNEPVHTSGESVRAQPGFACARPFCPMGPHPQDGRPQLSDSQTVQLVYGLGKGYARAAAQVSVCAKRLYRAGRREAGLGLGLPSAKSVEA